MSAIGIYRIGRRPDPWQYPDWSRANPDGTFGNRFDYPNGDTVLQRSGPRILTQNVSAVVYKNGFNGIRYLSKYGHDIENWALFEPVHLTDKLGNKIEPDDPALCEAFKTFKLVLG